MENFPKISIITPSFNQGQFLEETIVSILSQEYPNLEYIITDGGSTDNSVEIIKKYASKLKFWVTEKDKGQADAINKGLKHCTGDIFNWINSDDYLESGALQIIAQTFMNGGCDIVAGSVVNFDTAGTIEKLENRNISVEGILSADGNYFYHQPGVWLKSGIMKKVGLFNMNFHYCFDQEYILRYLSIGNKVSYLSQTLAYFRFHDLSKSVAQAKSFFWDFNRMYREFWKKNKYSKMGQLAKAKHKMQEWPLLQEDVGKINSKYKKIFQAALLIFRDPVHRLSKSNLGWLKHIIFK